jgi:hypothetical protein
VETVIKQFKAHRDFIGGELTSIQQCSCGTKDAAIIWCYVHGYLVQRTLLEPIVEECQFGAGRTAYRKLSNVEVLAVKPTDTKMIAQLVRGVRHTGPVQTEKFYERAAVKLAWFLKAGFPLVESTLKELSTSVLLNFYSDVTGDEMAMSDREFMTNWSDESAYIRRRIRIEKGNLADSTGKLIAKVKKSSKRVLKFTCIKCGEIFPTTHRMTKKCEKCGGPPDPTKRYCALGSKCFRSEKGRPHACLSKSAYCSETCLGSFQASVKRSRQADALPMSA